MKYTKGNLLDTEEFYILHGCNAQGVMGSGVAKAIRAKWPEAFSLYSDFIARENNPLGRYCIVVIGDKMIVNLITQDRYGSPSEKHARVDLIQSSINQFVTDFNVDRPMAIPKIGAGLGGLRWEDVEAALLDIERRRGVIFNVYEL